MLKYVVLAIIQGVTEFLPISSSGHIAIASSVLKVFKEPFFYIIVVHLGTTFSLLVFFFKDILKVLSCFETAKKILIVIGISLVFGFLGRDFFKNAVSNISLVRFTFFINGVILLLVNRKIKSARREGPTYRDSVFLGLAQVIGMLPGISRSGITISTLLFRGVKKEEAFRFSFLSAIPVIILAFIFEYTRHGEDFAASDMAYYVIGFFIAFIIGYISLFFLSLIIKRSRLDIFGYYCILLGILSLCLR